MLRCATLAALAMVLVVAVGYGLVRLAGGPGTAEWVAASLGAVLTDPTPAPARLAPSTSPSTSPALDPALDGTRLEITEEEINTEIAQALSAAPTFSSPLGDLRLSAIRLALHPGTFVAEGTVASPAGSLPLRAEGQIVLTDDQHVQMRFTDVRVSGAPAPAPVRDWLAGFATDLLNRAAGEASIQPEAFELQEGKLVIRGAAR